MELIAIIPFYNFFDNKQIIENHYRTIEDLERQQVPHLTLEVGLMGQYKLQKDDNVLQFPTQSILWHKEALINLGAKMVKDRYSYIAWIDSGLLLEDGWVDKAIDKLQGCDLIHCFDFGEYFDSRGKIEYKCMSYFKFKNENGQFNPSPGGALATKSKLFDLVDIYYHCIVGGGDAFLAEALYDTDRLYPATIHMSEQQRTHYEEWDKEIKKLGLSTGYINSKFYHLSHGSMRNRCYGARDIMLMDNQYDPNRDIVLSNGILEWTNTNMKLQQEVCLYFGSRR